MRLTPAEVHNVAFKKPSIGKRGYDEDEVDAFLDLVEEELARLIEDNNALTSRLAEAGIVVEGRTDEEAIAATPLPTAAPATDTSPDTSPVGDATSTAVPAAATPVPVSTGEAHTAAARLLGLAQETADRLTSEARDEAETTRAAARADSEKLVADATAESERIRTEAQTFSDDLLAEAHTKAETAEAEARTTKETILGQLASEKTELEQRIDGLRTYEREYRSRLKSWITDQLNQLDGDPGESTTAS
jgi:DivIVA domain-containing protein